MACSLSTISNRTESFNFGNIFSVYLYLNQTCAPSTDIFFPGTRLLTDAVCRKITGNSSSIWSGWTAYPISDIWTRIVTWKLPLFQLVSQFPRPPLGFAVETATMFHLLGDPIDSMTSMMVTLAICRSRVQLAKRLCAESDIGPTDPEYERTWKALAIIMVSYDECGRPDRVERFCGKYRESIAAMNVDEEIRKMYEKTGQSLAADRSTKSLPVVFAEAFFIGGWLIALLKAASSDPSPTNWANVEIHSIAISAMYLWVTSAVILGCLIGASQTEDSIPRLLDGFEPSAAEGEEIAWCKGSTDRAVHGGLYSWRPTKWKHVPKESGIGTGTLITYALSATLAVGIGYLTAAILSYFVGPRGVSCRHITESLMFGFWMLSFALEYVLELWLPKQIFWLVFWKDVFFALSNFSIVLVVQWGILNRCSCWTMWGLHGLYLPQRTDMKLELMYFIRHIAPCITFMAIFVQLLFCGIVAWTYWDAVRVYIQRDDGVSNWPWEKKTCDRKVVPQEEGLMMENIGNGGLVDDN